MPEPVFTIGHSTREVEVFVRLLAEAGVTVVVDVRRYPGSKRYPQFGGEALAARLREAGIGYIHEVDMGGRRRPSPDSGNTYWRNEQFRGYADHMTSPEFRASFERLVGRAETERQALLCSEAVPWRCHRQLIADALVARGYEVRHLYDNGRVERHVLNPAVEVQADGSVLYPAR